MRGVNSKPLVKVWSIRTDITIVNHEGNLSDCCCLAAVAALLHFRRPEVLVRGEELSVVGLSAD